MNVKHLEDEVNEMEKSLQIESSIKQEKLHMNMLHNFLIKYPALKIDLTTCTDTELANVLSRVYNHI